MNKRNKLIKWLQDNFKNRKDLHMKAQHLYAGLLRNHPEVLNEIFPKTRFAPTKENCVVSAKKYKNRRAWQVGDVRTYQWARINNLLEECCVHMSPLFKKHSRQSCEESALKYKSKNEWKVADESSYSKARRNNWFDNCIAHMKSAQFKSVVCLGTGETYEKMSDAERSLGLSPGSSIGAAIKRGGKAGGYHWKYADE